MPLSSERSPRSEDWPTFACRRAGALRASSSGDSILMKINPWYLAAPIPFCLFAVHEALGAQLLVLGVTLGIFFGTLSLRRPAAGDATTTHH